MYSPETKVNTFGNGKLVLCCFELLFGSLDYACVNAVALLAVASLGVRIRAGSIE